MKTMGAEAAIDEPIDTYVCGICMDEKTKEEIFTTKNPNTCSISNTIVNDHRTFCRDCMGKHVAAKIRETGAAASVRCPEPQCNALMDPTGFGALAASLPDDLIVRWEAAVCESIVRNACPYEDCTGVGPLDSSSDPTVVECTSCHRRLCPACRRDWHPLAECPTKGRRRRRRRRRNERVKNDGKAKDVKYLDRKFKGLVKSKNWKRCPNCKIYVEKQFGCEHIMCRCSFEFCYMCGKEWNVGHDCPIRFIRRQILRIRAEFKKLTRLCSCKSNDSFNR